MALAGTLGDEPGPDLILDCPKPKNSAASSADKLPGMDVEAELRSLETAMWTTATRGDRAWVDRHLSPTFTEFGRSGQSYDRDETLDQEIAEIEVVLPLPDLEMRWLADDIALLTYRSIRSGEYSNRASVWVRRAGRWLMEFHQGTPTTP